MRLVDLLDKLQQPPGEVVDLALALEYKVRQLCAIATGAIISHPSQPQLDDSSAQKRSKVAQEIDIDTAITSSLQLREFLDAYTTFLAVTKQNPRALTSFTESIIVSLTHLAHTPAVFVDLQGDVGGAVDHKAYIKTCVSLLSPLIKHLLDNAAFVKRSAVDGGGPHAFYGFSLYYALSILPLKKQAIYADHQGWYTIARTLRDVLRSSNVTDQPEEALKAVDIIALRPMAHNAEFGCKTASSFHIIASDLQNVLFGLSTSENLAARQIIDALLLILPHMRQCETLIQMWYEKRSVGERRKLTLTSYQLRSVGLALCSKFEPLQKFLLTPSGDGLLRPLIFTSGQCGSDLDDLVYSLLGRPEGGALLQHCMVFVTPDGITNICQRVFANFDAKLWLSWILALESFPRQRVEKRTRNSFPLWIIGDSDPADSKRPVADDYDIRQVVLEPIVKQIQLQLQRRSHSGCELIALLICALCMTARDASLWQRFAISHLQDITLHCVLNKFVENEGTVEVFGKPITIAPDASEDVFDILASYKLRLKSIEGRGEGVAQAFVRACKTDVRNEDSKINLVLDVFGMMSNMLGYSNIVNLAKVDLKKIPDLVLVRLFEISIHLTSQTGNAVPISSKMCAAVVKKISQYFVLIDKLNNQTLHETYAAGLAQLLKVAFKTSVVSTPANHEVDEDAPYLILARSLIKNEAQVARTFVSALLNTYINNRLIFAAKPTGDALLNILLYFFDKSQDATRDSAIRLSNYRDSDVSSEQFVKALTRILEDLMTSFCTVYVRRVPKQVWPKILSFSSVGDPQTNVSVKVYKNGKKAAKSAPATIVEQKYLEVRPVSQSIETPSCFDEEAKESCQCADLIEWLRRRRKEVSGDLNLQSRLSDKLNLVNGYEVAEVDCTHPPTKDCARWHEELFKMMCSIWCDIMRDGLLDPSLFVEFLKFSPRILGRNIGERQNSIVRALGLTLLGDEVAYTLWGPDNQFDYRLLIAHRKPGEKRECKTDTTSAVDSKADTSNKLDARSQAFTRLWSIPNCRILFGDWLSDYISRECRKEKLSVTLSILLDVIVYSLRMLYSSVPLGARPDKLLSQQGELANTKEPLFESVLRMLLPATSDSNIVEPTTYPLLCESFDSVASRRSFISLMHSNKILNCLSRVLTLEDEAGTCAVSECLEIIRELLALEVYRERIHQVILKEKRPRINVVITNSLHICARLEFIRRNILISEKSSVPYVLRCFPQILDEADRGDWFFGDLISSYRRLAVDGGRSNSYLESDTHAALWQNALQHSQSMLRFCHAQTSRSSESDSIVQCRVTACLKGLAQFLKPHS